MPPLGKFNEAASDVKNFPEQLNFLHTSLKCLVADKGRVPAAFSTQEQISCQGSLASSLIKVSNYGLQSITVRKSCGCILLTHSRVRFPFAFENLVASRKFALGKFEGIP